MSEYGEAVLKQALSLTPRERAALVEQLLASLDQPDPSVDALWAQESEDRIDAYENGALEAVAAHDVLRKYRKS